MKLKQLLFPKSWNRRHHSIARGERWYAIGDIHGRHDLLNRLFELIDADDEHRGHADTRLVFLGDYIDRGPQSCSVVELMMKLDTGDNVVFLMGNHEETLLLVADGNRRAATQFHKMGGRETLLSYGVTAKDYDNADAAGVIDLVRSAVPADHIEWMRNLPSFHQVDDFLFVHAGIRPGVALKNQLPSDLRWIRKDFLDSSIRHDSMIIHGHSVSTQIDERPNRIGIDTGAYATGKLTALGLEGTARWFLQT